MNDLQDVFASLQGPMEELAVLANRFVGVLCERKWWMWRCMLELVESRTVLQAKRRLVARRGASRKERSLLCCLLALLRE